MPGTKSSDKEMYSHLQHLEPAMAYVPCQEFTETFNLPYALSVGTIFPQLCKPFCGKRGSARGCSVIRIPDAGCLKKSTRLALQ